MNHIIEVKMGDMQTGQSPDILETRGIGSCVVIILYDPIAKTGGMAHAMLPTATGKIDAGALRYRFVDSTIEALVERLNAEGVHQSRLTAKLVGGAHMFSLEEEAGGSIGKRNIEQAKVTLQQKNIALIGEETGGSAGRNVRFDLASGICAIETRM